MQGNRPTAPSRPVTPDEPQLPSLRFGLRQFFAWVTGASILLAIFVAIPVGLTLLAIVLAVGVVALHVLSTALGTRLRDHANQWRTWEEGQPQLPSIPAGHFGPTALPPTRRSPWHGHDQPLVRIRTWLTLGAIVGSLFGVAALSLLLGSRTSLAGILVGSASTAVVGAWVAFIASSAWSIFRQGWSDALQDPDEVAAPAPPLRSPQ